MSFITLWFLIAFILKHIITYKISLFDSILYLLKNFINQSIDNINRFRFYEINNKKQHLISVYILLFVWILGLNILNKAFISLVLKTFFKVKPTLIVETLEDIVSNPNLHIAGKDFLHEIKLFKPDIYDILLKRILNYEQLMGVKNESNEDIDFSKFQSDVYNHKTVLLLPSFGAKIIKEINIDFNLMTSPVKYCQRFQYYYISKSYIHYRPIYELYVYLMQNIVVLDLNYI